MRTRPQTAFKYHTLIAAGAMTDRRRVLLGAALVTLILLVSSLGLLGGLGAAGSTASTGGASSTSHPTTASSAAATTPNVPSASAAETTISPQGSSASSSSSIYGIAQAENEISSGKIPRTSVFFPRSPTAGQTLAPGGEAPGPDYSSIPAPMGLADVGQGPTGAYEYTTPGFEGTIDVSTFTDYNPGYAPESESPNWMTFQLNSVTDNTSYPGATNGVFWAQNVVHYNGTDLEFEDNIWNFSSTAVCVEPGTLSGSGSISGCFYFDYGPTLTVTAPFTLSLFNNITLVSGAPVLTFGYVLTKGTTTTKGVYDTVTFNGKGSTSAPPDFEVNGKVFTPTGYLYYDTEFILGGNGGGTNAVLQAIDATAQLRYLNVTSAYVNVPSAYDYGADTAETAIGVAATYFGAVENLTTGPSMLYGLWNTTNGPWGISAPSTTWTLTVTGLPSYAFAFLQNDTEFTAGAPALSYWPAGSTGTLTTIVPALLDGHSYALEVYANGYTTGSFTFSASTSTSETLTANAAEFDTPVYLNTNAQATAFGASGVTGVHAKGGNLWINDSMSTIAAPFRLLNEDNFPTFLLFAEYDLSTNIYLNDFVQNPTTFNYTTSIDSTLTHIPGWTQGYYFNYGTGKFSVTNTTVTGDSTVYYDSGEISVAIAAVEFWWTFDSVVSHIVTAQDSFGVDYYFGTGSTVSDVSASTGAIGAVLFATFDATARNVLASGTDIEDEQSVAAYAEEAVTSSVDNATAEDGAFALVVTDVTDCTFDGVTALSDSDALSVEDATGSTFEDISVTGGSAGSVDDVTHATFTNVALTDTGALAVDTIDESTVTNVTTTGGVEGIAVDGAHYLSLTEVTASDDAIGVLVDDATVLNLTDVVAESGGLGVAVESSHTVRATDASASDQSVALSFESSLGITVTDLTVSSGALGFLSYLDDWLNLTTYNATESALSANYFLSSAIGPVPTAAVYSYEDQNSTLKDGVASAYNYGVVSNESNYLTVTDLHEVNGVWGVALTDTENSTVGTSFFYGNTIGIWTSGTFDLDVAVDTIEASTSYGLWVASGADAIVAHSNFVGNNGASTNGTYSSAHLQAGVSGTSSIQFNYEGLDNYWSDWNASVGPYTIAPGISDPSPLAAFYSNWLAFTETGLPHGTVWGILLDGTSYESALPLVILPSYSTGDPTFAYTVEPPEFFAPTPASGSVDYTGATNVTVPISFTSIGYGVTFDETGLATGATWNATLDGSTMTSTTTSISFEEVEGTYDWSVAAAGYTVAPSSGSVTVPGSDTTINVVFKLIPTYDVTFSESGLASGTSWSVTFNGTPQSSTTTSIVFVSPNGTYSYTIGTVTGYTITSPSSGSVPVDGAAQTVDVTFEVTPPSTFSVTFTESGLPSGTSWSVTLGTSTMSSDTTTIVFEEAAGSFGYTVGSVTGYSAVPSSGTVDTTSGAQSVSVTFTAIPPPEYSVVFTESGLPTGTSWSVTLNGTTHSSTNATVTFTELAGSYAYTVSSSLTGYTASPASGTVTVTSSGGSAAISFSSSPSKSTPFLGLSELDWAIIGVVLVLVIVGLAAALLMRRRGGSGSSNGSSKSGDSDSSSGQDTSSSESDGPGEAYE